MYIGLHVSTRYSCQILMEGEYSRHIFKKYSTVKFYENPPIWSRVVTADGQRDRYDEVNSRLRTRLKGCFPTVHIVRPTNPVLFVSHLATGDVCLQFNGNVSMD